MSYKINDKIKNITPYQPTDGIYKIKMDANESFINFADNFAGRFSSVVANLDFNRYPDPYATELCRIFAARHDIKKEDVTAGNGSDELISIIVTGFLEKGEAMLTLEPDFSMYRAYGTLSECKVESLNKHTDLTIAPNEVLDAIKKTNARLLVFSNPCNPTSLGLTRSEVLKIVAGTDALVVVDEAYMDFWNESVLNCVNDYDNLIVLKTCSKAVGAAGIRLGFAVANKALTLALKAVKSPYNVNSLTQAVGEVILSEKMLLARAVKEILIQRNILQNELSSLAEVNSNIVCVYKSCTNFIFMKMKNAEAVYKELLKKSIAVRLMGEYLRITVGSSEDNKEFLREFKHILK
ncbi:MAG: histidinol-phosphate transaminase [Hydrogenoanaerobacterium sp.]